MTPLLRPARSLRAGALLLALAALPLTAVQFTGTAAAAPSHERLAPLPGRGPLHGAPVHRSAPLQ